MLTRMIQSSISISLQRNDPLLIVERPKVGQHVSDKDNIGVAITAYDRKNKKDRYSDYHYACPAVRRSPIGEAVDDTSPSVARLHSLDAGQFSFSHLGV